MIIENLLQYNGVEFHQAIEHVRDSEPFAKVNPLWRDYAEGIFRPVASDARARIGANGVDNDVDNVAENMITQCINEVCNRIIFDRYGCEDGDVQAYLQEFSLKNRMDETIPSLIARILTDGNSALSVSWRQAIPGRVDSGRPVVHQESWWDGNTGIFVAVNDTRETLWAVSDFVDIDGKTERRTVYLPDRILRFSKTGPKGWELLQEIPRVRSDGRPMGVPVAHFTNGFAKYGFYTDSTVRKVIGSQDSLNATLFNRQAVVALTGSPIYWGTGVASDEGDQQVVPGTMWTTTNEKARFGAIPPSPLDSLHEEAKDLRATISGAFPVPSYRLGAGEWPSALALQRSDGPLIAFCNSLIRSMRGGLTLVAHRAIEQENIRGVRGDLLEEGTDTAKITVHFEAVDQVDPATQIEIDMAKVELYQALESLPDVLLEKTGLLTEDEMRRLKAEKKRREAEMAQAAMGAGTEFADDDGTQEEGDTGQPG